MLSCIVMASGYSKRLGTDKIFLKYGDKTLLEITLERLKSVDIEELIVVCKDMKTAELAKRYGKVVLNSKADLGQSESIKAGVLAADIDTDGYMFSVVDQPYMKKETISNLIKLFNTDKTKIVLPKSEKRKGNPVIFPKYYKEKLLKLSGDTGGRDIVQSNTENLLFLKVNDIELFDIDTKDDVDKLNRRKCDE